MYVYRVRYMSSVLLAAYNMVWDNLGQFRGCSYASLKLIWDKIAIISVEVVTAKQGAI